MKKICGWCDKVLEDGADEPVTVGICDDCDERVRAEEGLPPPEQDDQDEPPIDANERNSGSCSHGTMLPCHIIHREPDMEHREPEIRTR